MKRTSTLFAFVATTLAAVAQIPNGGFETWTSMGGYNTPDGWDNLNAMTDPMSVYTCTKGTPGSPGTSCLKLTSKTVSGMGVAPGVAVSGVVDQTTFLPVSGFAFDQRPVSLTGKWQYMAFGADQGHIAIYLTRWNTVTNMRETVASKTQNLSGMAMSWANFTINLTYTSGDAPDSAMIVLAASGDSPVNGSYLWVDNLAFTGTVVGIEESSLSLAAVSIYPNPATDNLTIDLGAGYTRT